MKVILCALDFSEVSENIVKQAVEMAANSGSGVTVLYAYRLLQPKGESIADYRKAMESRARTEFNLLVGKLGAEGKVPVEFRTEIGFLSDRIEAFAKTNPVNLIVMGQNLAHTINEHRGMTFENFLETVRIPVLVVPAEKVVA